MTRTIDLEALGATMGSFGNPPYAGGDTMYNQAYNNKLVLQGAIDQAYADGISEINFEAGILTLTYELYNNSTAKNKGEKLIKLKSNTVYDFSNLRVEVMYDSDYKSPYHTSTGRPESFKLHGSVFHTDIAYNVTIKNLNLQGDVYKRSWNVSAERWSEESVGIRLGNIGGNIKIDNCEVYAFCGASVTGGFAHNNNDLSLGSVNGDTRFRYFKPGYYDPKTDTVDTSNIKAYHSEWRSFNRAKHDSDNIYLKNFVEFARTVGPNYYFKYNSLTYQILFADENYKTIYVGDYEYGDLVYLPTNAVYVQMQFLEEPVHELTPEGYWDNGLFYGWRILIPKMRDVEISNSKFYDAHRGAITNMNSNTNFHHNRLWCNGLDSSVGAPLFPDTTRYHWNNEEGYNNGIHIHDNEFVDGFHSILMVSNNVTIENNKFINSGGVNCSKGNRYIIRGNEFKAGLETNALVCIGVGEVPDIGMYERTVLIENNRILDDVPFRVYNAFKNNLTSIIIKNNYIRGRRGYSLESNYVSRNKLIVEGNTFVINNLGLPNVGSIEFLNLYNFNNNIIEYLADVPISSSSNRLFLQNIRGKNNKVINANWFPIKTAWTYPETNIIKGIEFIDTLIGTRTLNSSESLSTTNFKDCKFTNSRLFLSKGNSSNEWVVNANFEDVTFEAFGDKAIWGSTASFITSSYNAAYFGNSMYNLSFKDCKVINGNSTPLKLFRTSNPDKDANIKIINTEYEGIGKLTDHIALNKKI